MATYQIRPATTADVPILVSMAHEAYPSASTPDPDGRTLNYFPPTQEGEASMWEWAFSLILGIVSNPENFTRVVVERIGDDVIGGAQEKLVAFTLWEAPCGSSNGMIEMGDPIPGMNVEDRLEMIRRRKETLEKVFPEEEWRQMWYCSDLVVLPSHKRRGFGTRLLTLGLRHVAATGSGVFLFALKPVMLFYLRMGIEAPPMGTVHFKTAHRLMFWKCGRRRT